MGCYVFEQLFKGLKVENDEIGGGVAPARMTWGLSADIDVVLVDATGEVVWSATVLAIENSQRQAVKIEQLFRIDRSVAYSTPILHHVNLFLLTFKFDNARFVAIHDGVPPQAYDRPALVFKQSEQTAR